jgi:hypothetical protein
MAHQNVRAASSRPARKRHRLPALSASGLPGVGGRVVGRQTYSRAPIPRARMGSTGRAAAGE